MTRTYIERNPEGTIITTYSEEQYAGQEFIDGNYELPTQEESLPIEFMVQDIGTGQPVKVVVKNGEVYVGGADETP